jgi:anti-sigma regulatory factor (Ser/Thr protein kinase)
MMSPLTTYTATCWREGTSWTARIVQLDRTTRAARLSDVISAARRLIAAVTDTDPQSFDVVLEVQVPEGISELLDAASAARQEADVVSVEAVAVRRSLARQLIAHGYGLRDIAGLLGVSYARAKQLTVDTAELSGRVKRPGDHADFAVADGARPHSSYQHEAFLYRNDDEFLAGTVPFVQNARALGQPIMIALIKPRMQMLQAALGPTDGEVRFVDMAELGANPARIIPAWLDFIEQHRGRPIRGIGEPQWPGRRAEEVIECQLHEALLNVAIDPDIPLWLRCPYDLTGLDAPIARAALDSHPAVVEVDSYRGSTSYGGLHNVDSIFRSDLPPALDTCSVVKFGGSDLRAVRVEVDSWARDCGLDGTRSHSLSSAVAEIAANSVRHGGGCGELRTWVQPNALVCQVTDRGELASPMVGRRTPGAYEEANRGLWLAHQISDLVQLRSTPAGSTARVFAWL